MFLKNKVKILILALFISSCQPIEITHPVDHDISSLETISVNASKISVNLNYNPIFSENNIEDQLKDPPILKIQYWIKSKIN